MILLKLTVCLLPLIIAFSGVNGQQVLGTPVNTVAVVGETAKLYCKYHLNSCFEIRWQKRLATGQLANISDGNRVSDRRYRLDNSSVCILVIQGVQLTDSGTFICTIARSRFGLADLIVQANSSCSTNCEKDTTAEGDEVDFKCKLTYRGDGRPEMTWWNKLTGLEVSIAAGPPGKSDRSTVSRDFSWKAVAPAVAPLVCLTRFYFDQTNGRASNVPEVRCETESCDILYSVRNVVTWPLLFASPGEEITCKADGNPEPSFEWQQKEKDGGGEWEDVPDETSEKIEAPLNNETSIQLRCVAKNTVNDEEHSENSLAVTVSKHGAAIRTAIIVGVVVAIAILAIIAGVIYKFFFSE